MSERRPDAQSERRLDELRREAERTGRVDAPGVRAAGSPLPPDLAGYYGLPLLKPPVWTWEIPTYFFVGGAGGVAAVIAVAAKVGGASERLVRDARWIAAAGAALSAPLLIADLGRPERFLSMLRVFKPQSPMSVGAWIVAAFSISATGTVIAEALDRRTRLPLRIPADVAATAAALSGLGMATYTGVLLGATAIPVWNEHAGLLPAHFAASALGSAVAIINLRGHRQSSLQALAIGAAAFETCTGYVIERNRSDVTRPLRHGASGVLTRIGGVLSGPIPLLLRTLGVKSKRARRFAAASTIVGSLVTRFAWVEAGKASANDPTVVMKSRGAKPVDGKSEKE